ncbi:hypothetical protein WSK_3142 [Novosphingobium sp. Rr 2-17]|uniref:hypothetical protein n=1 Tax=Novosphingobium sp. Rr 2-17 TaxID=555793 RepID=UPI0002698233|nr:hypothetical protein [Novosphingobium sp. Rr 2-17]EIZ78260.1 hypothetical protein WSK_3142 [Novosphingobium sp. Rr 2-17]
MTDEPERIDITWLDPIRLKLSEDDTVERLVARLKDHIKAANVSKLERSVYIIRMAGSFVIAYPSGASPVVYIGRGDSVSRLAKHLKKWATGVFTWGSDTSIEIRVLRPSRKNRPDYFKNVEADLLEMFSARFGGLPLINKRYEHQYEGCVDYGTSQTAKLNQAIGIGKGNRHKWAIKPMPSNPHYDTYFRGEWE